MDELGSRSPSRTWNPRARFRRPIADTSEGASSKVTDGWSSPNHADAQRFDQTCLTASIVSTYAAKPMRVEHRECDSFGFGFEEQRERRTAE